VKPPAREISEKMNHGKLIELENQKSMARENGAERMDSSSVSPISDVELV
jgi:hypothetical protein